MKMEEILKLFHYNILILFTEFTQSSFSQKKPKYQAIFEFRLNDRIPIYPYLPIPSPTGGRVRDARVDDLPAFSAMVYRNAYRGLRRDHSFFFFWVVK